LINHKNDKQAREFVNNTVTALRLEKHSFEKYQSTRLL
jgi:hypothetical protein